MTLRIFKDKNKKTKALLVVLFLAFGIFFASSNDVKAVEQKAGICISGFDAKDGRTQVNSNEECSAICKQKNIPSTECKYIPNEKIGDTTAVEKVQGADLDNPFLKGFKIILIGVFNVVGWLFAIAATLFAWVVDPANISGQNGMLNKQAVKDVWIMARDLLNMSFILVLLFAAFGTIFQMDKWNIKKVWLNILINALLVNFSYPIARIIIDISNVAFYYLLNNLFSPNGTTAVSGSSIFAGFGNSSSLGQLLMPQGYSNYDVAYLIASIVAVFILGMTLMVIAGLFVVRLIALTMLIMFSPIGFVGYAIPSMSGYADKWWKNLLNYSFFAPIMIFVMAIALRVMEAMRNENFQSMLSNANANSPGDQANWIANAAFYVIPIIILWTGIGIAKTSGIAGASAVTGTVTKWGKKIANIPWAGTKMGWNATGIPGGFKQTKDYYAKRGVNLGPLGRRFGTDQTEGTNAWVAQNIGRVPNAYNNNLLKKMGEAAKDHNMEDMDPAVLQRIADTGSEAERLAALEQLAKGGDIKEDDLSKVIEKFGEKSQIGKRILGKVKESRPDMAFAHIENDSEREIAMRKFINSDKFDAKKLGSETLKNDKFMAQVIAEGKLDQKAREALISKNPANAEILNGNAAAGVQGVVEKVASAYIVSGKTDMTNAEHRNVQMAHLASTGKIHTGITNPNDVKEIFKRINKDHSGGLTTGVISSNIALMGSSIDNSKLVDIVKNIKKPDAKRALVRGLSTLILPPGASPAERQNLNQLKALIRTDPYLQSIS